MTSRRSRQYPPSARDGSRHRRATGRHLPACATAQRSHSRAPSDTLSVADPTTTPPCGQRGVLIGEQTRPWRSRRRGGVRAGVGLAAAPPRHASQERCAANRASARPLAALVAVSVRSFEAALSFKRELRVMPPQAATRSFHPRVARRDSRSTTGAWRHARPNSAPDCKFRGSRLRRHARANARSHLNATFRFR